MNILLVYPQFPDTFWGLKYALKFISKKATHPPLGLLTVAAMLPKNWEKKLVDMNVTTLKDKDLVWADYVFISAMSIQRASVQELLIRCKRKGVKTVAGGPLFTTECEAFEDVDHLVLNEAETTLPPFLEDLGRGCAARMYCSNEFPDIATTPLPLWELISMKKYAEMSIQYSRGCPFHCEFCNIPALYGHKVRTKGKEQIIRELEAIYRQGWRGDVFLVDDNFIGNKGKLKRDILPAMSAWMEEKQHPFTFNTEASINLSDDEELMELMVKAGFASVFVGIETPNEESLAECNKVQNTNRDLVGSVRKIQGSALYVTGGFIVGFDNDPPSIFERMTAFIRETGIVTAMVGLLNAPRGTKLYQRLVQEGRLLKDVSGDNTDFSMNFIPHMDYDLLIKGYKDILGRIYSPATYYIRVREFLKEYTPLQRKPFHFHVNYLGAFLKSMLFLGIIGKERFYYWRLFFWSLFRRPQLFPLALTFSIYGYHFRKIFEKCM